MFHSCFGNTKAVNYRQIIRERISAYKALVCHKKFFFSANI